MSLRIYGLLKWLFSSIEIGTEHSDIKVGRSEKDFNAFLSKFYIRLVLSKSIELIEKYC